jgi:photosystem II stability/assembly factor-like uncharacterized protein
MAVTRLAAVLLACASIAEAGDARCVPEVLATRAAGDVWLADRCGNLFRSADAGDHWSEITNLPFSPQHLIGLWWFSEQRGLLVESSGFYRETSDGGKHWDLRRLMTHGPLLAAARARDALWICDADSRLFRSEDAGRTFRRGALPFRGAGCGTIAISDPQHGFVAASGGPRPSWRAPRRGGWSAELGGAGDLWRTDDGGRHWERAAVFPVALPAFSAARESAELGWVFGAAGQRRIVLATLDGGRSWSERDVPHPEFRSASIDRAHPLDESARSDSPGPAAVSCIALHLVDRRGGRDDGRRSSSARHSERDAPPLRGWQAHSGSRRARTSLGT